MRSLSEISVFVIDDHPLIRTGLSTLIDSQSQMHCVGQAGTVSEALIKIRDLRPDVVLLDLGLPDGNGLDIIRELGPMYPEMKFIILSVYGGSEDIYRSLQLGAYSYLLKDAETEEVMQAIRLAKNGKKYIPNFISAKLVEKIHHETLSGREQEILELIAAGKSNMEIAEALEVTEATIKKHVSHIFEKFGVSSRSQAIRKGLDLGLLHLKSST